MKEKEGNVPLWNFYYHQGPAPKYGVVEARDEATAMKVAQRWCQMNGYRQPASVQPMICATEAILREPLPGPEEMVVVPDAVEATTGVNKG